MVDPLLWNLVYDLVYLLARFDNHVNLRTIAFADDLPIVA